MTTSLDGFVADQTGSAARLYPDLAALWGTAYMNAVIEQTGAVLMGKRTFAMGDPDWHVGNYEFQVPIFVVTHQPPDVQPKQDEHLTFTFVTDGVESAIAQATAAAGDRAVQVVGGVSLARQLLHAGLVDELHLDVMPLLLGAGLRFFENTGLERVRSGQGPTSASASRSSGARTSNRGPVRASTRGGASQATDRVCRPS